LRALSFIAALAADPPMIDPTLMVSVIRIYLADRNIGFDIVELRR
jgi:hypothetical protein